jgi:two-component system response regulator WspF
MRIALVNDLAMAVEAMRRIVTASREHKLAWIAADGAEAVKRCAEDTPDLILMDLIMPRLDGVEATRRIMTRTPCAIVVVTADVQENSPKVFEAMGAGALDAVNTPVLEHPGATDGAKALLAKIETIRRLTGGRRTAHAESAARRESRPGAHRHTPLVTIGASAGGPAALAKVLSRLEPDFPAPVVMVQHVDTKFVAGLAAWLDSQSPLRVRLAREGDRPEEGVVLLAGQENHLVFAGPARLDYTGTPTDCPYRPSIDVFLRSADRFWPGDIIAVLLTGMGRDGAEGLRTLNRHGHYTIAQDRTTSAVYGMPGAAAELHAATEILALDKIAPRLTNIAARMLRTHA